MRVEGIKVKKPARFDKELKVGNTIYIVYECKHEDTDVIEGRTWCFDCSEEVHGK